MRLCAVPEAQYLAQVRFRLGIFARPQIDPAALQERIRIQPVPLQSCRQDLLGIAGTLHGEVPSDQPCARIAVRRIFFGQFLELHQGGIALPGSKQEQSMERLIALVRKSGKLPVGLFRLLGMSGPHLHGA